jgi:hypothetical protein
MIVAVCAEVVVLAARGAYSWFMAHVRIDPRLRMAKAKVRKK